MKKIIVFLLVVLLTISAVTSVSAVRYDGETYEDEILRLGYTQEDVLELKAIHFLSEENVKPFILQKYDELKDWKKVREYYGVSEEKYENYMIGEKMRQETRNSIPSYIFDEMEDRGWTKTQISNFVNRGNISKIDWDYAWKECKTGRTIEDVQKERMAADKDKSILDTNFIQGKITLEEYKTRVTEILNRDVMRKTDNMVEEAVESMIESKKETVARWFKSSGLTDDEIDYCESQGIKNEMDIYQAKLISAGNDIPLEDVVQTFKRCNSWSVTVVELLYDTPEEYIKMLEESIENDPSPSNSSGTKEKIREVKEFYELTEDGSYVSVEVTEADEKNERIDIEEYTTLLVGSSKAYVNGVEKKIDEETPDVSVFVEENRSYVPIRFISENYGGDVEWVQETQTVNISFDNRKISLTIGKPEIYINGEVTSIDVAPILKNGRTFLPLRACVNALDKKVFYSNGLILIGENADNLDETEHAKEVNEIIENYFQ